MADIGVLVGALIPTLVLSRLLLLAMRSWDGGLPRLLVANGGSLLIAALIGGMGMADGGAFAGMEALTLYALPQAVWLIMDIARHRKAIFKPRPARNTSAD